MENPFGIGLLIIAGIIYKVYKSFQEEQNKAKERMEKLKRQQQTVTKQVDIPMPKRQMRHPAPNIPHQKQETVQQKPRFEDYPEFREVQKPIVKEDVIYREDMPEEVVHIQEMKRIQKERYSTQKSKDTTNKLQRVELHPLEEHSFDLRQAVIQEAILKRPYQD
ncbi:hypothetical protein [Sphingobacterium kyonggiense]